MKICPQCHTEYEDEMRFCLQDGVALAEPYQFENQTESFTGETVADPKVRPQPTINPTVASFNEPEIGKAPERAADGVSPPTRGKKRSYLFALAAGAFFLVALLLAGAGVGAWYFLSSQNKEVSVANTNASQAGTGNREIEITNSFSNGDANSDTSHGNVNENLSVKANANNLPIINTNTRKELPAPAKKAETASSPQPDEETFTPVTPKSAPKTIAGGVVTGKAISVPKPAYPPAARAANASGSVTVQVLIDESGRVVSATAVSGHPLLQAAAVAAARQALFRPTLLSGQPVKVSGTITYNFVP